MRWSAIWCAWREGFDRTRERRLIETDDGGFAGDGHGHGAEATRDELLIGGEVLVDVPDVEWAAGA